MAETPTSYKDPFWTQLASATEQKLDLPPGLLVGVLTRGERSNADQVSEAGAKTPFQIIPATRKAAIDKYGIDPYLSPENAAEVAGKLLKDSLDRNKGDAAAAVGEYHGGTDRSNWGTKTKAYVKRVTGALPADAPAAPAAADPGAAPAADGPSTFEKLWGAANAPQPHQVASILQAYQSGQMAPEDAKQFKDDVTAGRIMLPQGATLDASAPAPTAMGAGGTGAALPAGVVEAYRMGKITGADRDQLLADVKAGTVTAPAGSALDLEARFPDRDYKSARIPGVAGVQRDEQGRPYVGAATAAPATIGEQIVGAGEAALAGVTGATTGFTGAIGATIGNMAAQVHSGLTGDGVSPNDPRVLAVTGGQASRDGDPDLLQAQNEAGAGLTYAPRTDAGQHQAAALGDAMAPLVGLAPVEAGALHSGATPIVQAVRGAARATPAAVADVVGAVKSGAGAVADAAGAAVDRVRGNAPAARATPGTMGSAGAAGTDVAAQRVALGQQMDVPIELTKGQATRDFEQQRFERETQKDPSAAGAMLRDRAADQNGAVQRNFDVWLDQTGAEAPDLRGAGMKVVGALQKDAADMKAQVRAAYKHAEETAGDTPVTLAAVVDHLNQEAPAAATAPILDSARKYALKLGIATEGPDGTLVAQPATLKRAEMFRQADRPRHRLRADERPAVLDHQGRDRFSDTAHPRRPRVPASAAPARELRQPLREQRGHRQAAGQQARHERPAGGVRGRLASRHRQRLARRRAQGAVGAADRRRGRAPGLARAAGPHAGAPEGSRDPERPDGRARPARGLAGRPEQGDQGARPGRQARLHLRQAGRPEAARRQRPVAGHVHRAAGQREHVQHGERRPGRARRSRRDRRCHRPAGARDERAAHRKEPPRPGQAARARAGSPGRRPRACRHPTQPLRPT
jgi:hypothetical protein